MNKIIYDFRRYGSNGELFIDYESLINFLNFVNNENLSTVKKHTPDGEKRDSLKKFVLRVDALLNSQSAILEEIQLEPQQTDQHKKQNNEEYDLCKMKDMLKDNYGKQCNGLMDRTCDNMMSMESNSPDSMSYDRINNSRGHGIGNLRIRCLSCNRMAKDLDDKI